MHAKSLQSCLILCDPMNHSLPGSSVHAILKNTGVGSHVLQEIFPTKGLNSQSPALVGGFFTASATWEVPHTIHIPFNMNYFCFSLTFSLGFCSFSIFSPILSLIF